MPSKIHILFSKLTGGDIASPLLCRSGIHSWESDIPDDRKEYVRITANFSIFSSGEQLALQKCECCDKDRYVHRSGLMAAFGGGSAGKWRRASERDITRLRTDRTTKKAP